MLGANAAGHFQLKPVLIYHSENPRALKSYSKSTQPVLQKKNHKTWVIAHLSAAQFTEYFKSIGETYFSEKKIPLHNITAH